MLAILEVCYMFERLKFFYLFESLDYEKISFVRDQIDVRDGLLMLRIFQKVIWLPALRDIA